MTNQAQLAQIKAGQGFIAALDQSGGSTPKALALYGVGDDRYDGDAQMYDLIHEMRARIAMAPAFSGDKVLGAILFEMTMDREISGKPSATFLWEERGVVPFLKVDKGLAETENGAQLMKPMPELDQLCERAVRAGVFGTKMRSVIHAAHPEGIKSVVAQQFAVAKQIMAHGLVPIIEPEITISISDKAEAEDLLCDVIKQELDQLSADQVVMLKLTLPENANKYKVLADNEQVASVVALSGGYSREEANDRLSQNTGMIASFSRALTQGLSADQDDAAFNSMIGDTIESIYQASIAG